MNPQIKKPHLKMIPIKDNWERVIWKKYKYFFLSIVWWISNEELATEINLLSFFNYIDICSVKNLYINYHTLSTPGNLYESSYIFSSRIIHNSLFFGYIYIYTYIYIMFCCYHGFPKLSFTICLYHSLHLAVPPDCILCPYRAVVDKF